MEKESPELEKFRGLKKWAPRHTGAVVPYKHGAWVRVEDIERALHKALDQVRADHKGTMAYIVSGEMHEHFTGDYE